MSSRSQKAKIQEQTERYTRVAGHLNTKRREAAETTCAPPEETATFAPTTGDPVNGDEETPCTDFDYGCDPEIAVEFQERLFTLAAIPEEFRNIVHYKNYLTVLIFAFILYSLSRPALRPVRRFSPLPSDSTAYRYFHHSLSEHETNLRRESRIENQLELFMELSGVQEVDVVSVAGDSMAMNPDQSGLAAKPSDYKG
jgi:hypothetical protein